MKILFVIAALTAIAWGLRYAVEVDSFWRLLVALAASIAGWRALHKEWYPAAVCLLVAAGVLFKVMLVGADQRAGLFDWPASTRWELWMMLTWLGVGYAALRISLEAAASFAIVGIAFAMIWWHEAVFLHVIAEVACGLGIASIWRRLDGELIGMVDGSWRPRSVGGSYSLLGRLVGGGMGAPSRSAMVRETEK